MSIAIPPQLAPCPVQYLMIFLGIDEGPANIEQSYLDLKSLEDLKQKGKDGDSILVSESAQFYDFVAFKQVGTAMQPAVWLGFNSNVDSADTREAKVIFPQIFVAKYMKILLIDAYRRHDTNIDIDHVIPGGFMIPN